ATSSKFASSSRDPRGSSTNNESRWRRFCFRCTPFRLRKPVNSPLIGASSGMMTLMDSRRSDLCLLTDSCRSGAILLCRWLSDLALARFVTVNATPETSSKKPDSQISLRWGNVLFMSAGQIFQNQKLPKRNWRTPECKDNAAGPGQGKSLILLRDFEKSRLRRL